MSVVLFMMQKLALMNVIVQPSTNEDDEIPLRVVLGGANMKGGCSTAHTHTQNEMMVPPNDSLRK